MSKLNEHARFVLNAYAGLVLRGYDKASEIDDPILSDIWRLGRKLAKKESLFAIRAKAKPSRRDP